MTTATKTPKAVTEAEEAVRTYVAFLADEIQPDAKAVAAAEKALAKATDPIERMKAHVALTEARVIDGESITDAFIAAAPVVAEHHGFSAEAFEQICQGVPRSVLAKAGLTFTSGQSNGHRVTQEEIRAQIPESGDFTIAELAEATGASVATANKLVRELVTEKAITSLGKEAGRNGRPGKPPEVFQVAV